MTGFVDIHAHLLPGIDDGPRDMADSLEMARTALAAGTSTMVATPHLRSDFPDVNVAEITSRCSQLKDELKASGIALTVESGGECSLMWALEASDEQLAQASFGGRGKDLLVETPADVSTLDHLLYQLRLRGIRVTLAHPERSAQLRHEPRRVESLHDQGILLQVNAGSLLSQGRSHAGAEHLCREGLAHVLASDGHSAAPPRAAGVLAEGVEVLARLVGAERARWMASDAPRAIISGDALPRAPEVHLPQRRWLRRRG